MRHRYISFVRSAGVYILDTIFPPSEETLIVRHAEESQLLRQMMLSETAHVRTYLIFDDVLVRACIHEAKFHNNRRAMQLLARALTVVLHNTTGAETIVPIPLAKKRKAERGYNQIEEVLRYVRTDSVLHIETRALKRIRNTRPQTKLTRKERAQNVADAFLVTKPERIRNKNIILIDDVVTTGATLQAAKAALMPHKPASVACIALARAE